jgi:hypothetical protein
MEVLVPPGFDLKSIDKCLADQYCNFVELDDIEKRIGTIFVILQEKYFIFYTAKHHNIICDYNCRNFVMRHLYPKRGGDPYYDNLINSHFNGKLKLINNIFYNTELPYMFFTKENIMMNGAEDNTIVEYYQELNIEKFAQIVKKKQCYDKFFIVYLGNEQYMCCNTHTLETYQYNTRIKYGVVLKLYDDIDSISRMKTEDKKVKILQRVNDFHMIDITGHQVTENKDYYLKIFNDNDDSTDVLEIFNNELSGGTSNPDLIVQCVVENNIVYIKHENKYLYASEDNFIKLSRTLPTKSQRLQFHFTNNKFKVVKWNQNAYLTIEWVKASYGAIMFDKWRNGTELYLERLT